MNYSKFIQSIFCLLLIASGLMLYPMDSKQQKEAQAASYSVTDQATVQVITKLLNQHLDAILSFNFPDSKSHAKYNNELPILFNELKILHAQLSPEGKKKFSSEDIQLFESLETTCWRVSETIIGIDLNPKFINNRTQTQMCNIVTQLTLQHSMIQWFSQTIDPKRRAELQPKVDQVNTQFVQAQQQITSFTAAANAKALKKWVEKDQTKNPTANFEEARIMLCDPSDVNPPNLPFNPQTKLLVPQDVQHGLAQGGEHTQRVIEYFTANPQTLLAQDEEGWTPLMQAAAQGHLGMLNSLTQIVARIHYSGSEIKYTQEYQVNQGNGVSTPLEFICVFDPMIQLDPIDLKQITEYSGWTRDYVVKGGRYRPLKCCAYRCERSKLELTLENRRKKGMPVLSGLGAYILIKTLEVKSKSYPSIEVIDDAEQHNALVAKRKEYQAKLGQHIDTALDIQNNVSVKGIPVKPLRALVHSYLSTDLPHTKDKAGCVIS